MASKCPKHPNYNGRKEPEVDCVNCLVWHLHVNQSKTRNPIPPSKRHKDKSKYRRREKHQKDIW